MAMNPSVQEKAQVDIDRVAPNRLPTLDDYDSLPYIRAIIKEVLRWDPIAPIGFFCIDIPLFSTWYLNSFKDYRTRWCKMTYMTTISSQKAPRLLRISGASSLIFWLTHFYIPRGQSHTTKKYTQIPSRLIRVDISEMMPNPIPTSLFLDSGGGRAQVCFRFV